MIKELTQEQKDKFPFYIKKWTQIANSVVGKDFYTPEVIDMVKDCIVLMYADQNANLDKENILVSSSPKMSPFIAAARVYGKPGKPKKFLPTKYSDMKEVEAFVNQFSNPSTIVEKAKEFCENRYWGSIDAGFWSYVDFFRTETELGQTVLKPKEKLIQQICDVFVPCVFDMIYRDDFCVFSKRQVYQDFDTSGDYPVAVSGKIKWIDGTEISY